MSRVSTNARAPRAAALRTRMLRQRRVGQIEALDQQVLPVAQPDGVIDQDIGERFPARVGHGCGSSGMEREAIPTIATMRWPPVRRLAGGPAVGYVTGTHPPGARPRRRSDFGRSL